ncbi:MAG: putative sulfate exporter family transporter [Chitinophagaceae bacterium]
MTEVTYPATTSKKIHIHEDWTVVLLGILIIALSLSGMVLPVAVFKWNDVPSLLTNVINPANLLVIIMHFAFVMLIAVLGIYLSGKPVKLFLAGFPIVFLLTTIALIIAGNGTMRGLNLEAVIFSLILGLIIGNFFTILAWLRAALSTEMFVKIGLVLLDTGVIFSDILKAGSLGLIQALAVVISVWYFAYWLCRKLKVDEELTMMISSAVSIVSPERAGQVKDSLKNLQGLWFVLAFTSIGLETRFADLFNKNSKRPLYAFLIAQAFNILVTLVIAYYLFRR